MSKGFLDHKDFNNPKERTILRHNATIVTKDVRHSILRPHLCLRKGDPEVHFLNAMLFCRYYDLPEKLNLNKLVVLGSPVSKIYKYTV